MLYVHEQLLESSMVRRLEGSYTLKALSDDQVEVSFELLAELHRVPLFIQRSIANLIVAIALGELNKYVTAPRCKVNLQSYGILPR